ncbi:glycosyltransferase [Candidatus Pantoea deserta]|uniref:Glycosyltransferase n=1 Tax=Candidatus Pantoea deserta TaxID=1869313 RepID=A0A3N4P205_9GAMM|nr:glycosyltransferase family 4 protein [Pantoea deserta]RPE01218.1 glycosyltransferase [Pantoea deserta]
MKIIVSGQSYPEKRNILVNEQHTYVDFKYKNVWLYLNKIRQKAVKANKSFIFQPVSFLMPGNVEIIHLFNEVARTSKRWVSTFETELPRVLPVPGVPKLANPELKKQLRLVAAPQCVAIIAISEATRQIQLKLLSAFPEEASAITPKLHKLHPPQPVLYEGQRSAQERKLIFTFAGNEFYRKGGAEVVLAFTELVNEGKVSAETVQVNLIGNLKRRYNFAHGRYQDEEAFYQKIEQLLNASAVFNHAESQPNNALIDLFKRSHAGLLPTWQDTYGFSVLEMQACGCPVISTNVRALPEINPPEAGWIIPCPLSDMFELTINSANDKEAIRQLIVSHLKTCILAILADRETLMLRSQGALKRIRDVHDPARFREKLNDIYALSAVR